MALLRWSGLDKQRLSRGSLAAHRVGARLGGVQGAGPQAIFAALWGWPGGVPWLAGLCHVPRAAVLPSKRALVRAAALSLAALTVC